MDDESKTTHGGQPQPAAKSPAPAAADKKTPAKTRPKGLRGLLGSLFGRQRPQAAPAPKAAPPPAEDPAPDTAEQEQLERDRAASIQPAKGHWLYRLSCRQWGTPPGDAEAAEFSLSQLMEGNTVPNAVQRAVLKEAERQVRTMACYAPPQPAPKTAAAPSPTEDTDAPEGEDGNPQPEPVPASALFFTTRDKMEAYLLLLPPCHGGEDADPDAVLRQAGEEAKLAFGLNEQKVVNTCTQRSYLRLTRVAQGTPPQDGENGRVEDHYKRETAIQLTVKDDNTIDYKDLGWLQTVFVDDVICTIVLPQPATPGTNVHGEVVPGKDGRKATVPKGGGTRLNEDETALVAAIDGVVSYEAERFRVDPLLIIKGDVEISTGNLNVVGDVLIHGDIREGFSVEATGNITVQGMIEGAKVVCGGNIQVGRGMNGNSTGSLKAKGDILSKFLENANVTAGGRIISDTIINSTLQCDDSVQVTTGRGSIIGGKIAVLKRLEATTIGNQSNRAMEIVMGSSTAFLREMQELEKKHAVLAKDVDNKEKNIRYLESLGQSLSSTDAHRLDELRLGLSVQKMQLANLSRRIDMMQRRQNDNNKCQLQAETIYPPLSLTIGDASKTIRDTCYSVRIFLKEGEVHVAVV